MPRNEVGDGIVGRVVHIPHGPIVRSLNLRVVTAPPGDPDPHCADPSSRTSALRSVAAYRRFPFRNTSRVCNGQKKGRNFSQPFVFFELAIGFEPTTGWLQISCSTD